MNIVSLNNMCSGSTGTIMRQVCAAARARGHQATSFSARGLAILSVWPPKIVPNDVASRFPGHRYFGSWPSSLIHKVLGITTGYIGCFSFFATLNLLLRLERLQPDLLHLHNIHGNNINLPLLFRYIKKKRLPVVWTLHDCWAFTGRCPHFELLGCDRWKSGCHDCPYPKHSYPAAMRDRSAWLWRRKRSWFTGAEALTLVTPSRWLRDLVLQSYLKDYPVEVIHNGIDRAVFKPTPGDFRARFGIPAEKPVLLGVAFDWGERKGLDIFCELAGRLGDAAQIVLVGTDERVDALLPESILSIHRTQNREELAEIYTAADVFVNPTREDNFPTVNLEALSCGTPVVTFDTGGSPEALDESCGLVVPKDDVDALEAALRRVCGGHPFSEAACIRRAALFDCRERFEEYVALYERKSRSPA